MHGKALTHIWIPLFINAILISLYFSQNSFCQSLVSPTLEELPFRSWREFGLLEQLQNLLILATVIVLAHAARKQHGTFLKICFSAGTFIFLFLLLEEIDYGVHFYSYFTGNSIGDGNFNLHNLKSIGPRQNGTYLKKLSDLSMIICFILLPLLHRRATLPPSIQAIVPSLWFIPTLAIAAGTSSLAHYLDGLELDMINGIRGSLFGNTSEFRETNTYYICLLYALQLANKSPHSKTTSHTSKYEHGKGSR